MRVNVLSKDVILNLVTNRWLICGKTCLCYEQWQTVRVFKVFSEYPGILEKYVCLEKPNPLQIKIQHYDLLL